MISRSLMTAGLTLLLTSCAPKPRLLGGLPPVSAGSDSQINQDVVTGVHIERNGETVPAKPGTRLRFGDVVTTDTDARVVLLQTGGNLATVTTPTVLMLEGRQRIRQRGGTVLHESLGRRGTRVLSDTLTVVQQDGSTIVSLDGELTSVTALFGTPSVDPAGGQCSAMTLQTGETLMLEERGCLPRRPMGAPELVGIVEDYNRLFEELNVDDGRIVPHTVGLPGVDGFATMGTAGLKPKLKPVPVGSTNQPCMRLDSRERDEEEMGCVISQSLPGGSRARAGSAVRLKQRQRMTHVPQLVGLLQDEAQERLDDGWLEMEVSDDVPDPVGITPLTVSRSIPAAGTALGEGDTVVVLLEPESALVPRVIGMRQDEANAALAALGLNMVVEEVFAVDGDNTVIRQVPAADLRVVDESEVTITMERPGVAVPAGLRGLDADAARELLDATGLRGRIRDRVPSDLPRGQVVSHEPVDSASTSDAIVWLTLSTGP